MNGRLFQSSKPAGKLPDSATPATLRVGRRAPAPGLPIRPGAFFFQPWRLLLWIGAFVLVWGLGFSGLTGLDL